MTSITKMFQPTAQSQSLFRLRSLVPTDKLTRNPILAWRMQISSHNVEVISRILIKADSQTPDLGVAPGCDMRGASSRPQDYGAAHLML